MTWDQRLRAAVGHYCNGITQECIGELYGVNFGRVNEACIVLRAVAEDPKKAREVLAASGKFPEL